MSPSEMTAPSAATAVKVPLAPDDDGVALVEAERAVEGGHLGQIGDRHLLEVERCRGGSSVVGVVVPGGQQRPGRRQRRRPPRPG